MLVSNIFKVQKHVYFGNKFVNEFPFDLMVSFYL